MDELKQPLHDKIIWERDNAGRDEISLSAGVRLDFMFPDGLKILETAYSDFKRFLKAGRISLNGSFRITAEKEKTGVFESYRIEVSDESCRILSNDTEGIRRGIVFLEDEN